MRDETFFEVLRWLNVILASIGFLWLTIRSILRVRDYPYTMRLYLWALAMYAIGVAEGSGEAALMNLPGGVRPFLYLAANIALLIALTLTQKKFDVSVAHREGRPRV